jgi:hypothetical protein
LKDGIERIAEMVPRMYQGVPAMLHGAAARSVFAHVLHMRERGLVAGDAEPTLGGRYTLV